MPTSNLTSRDPIKTRSCTYSLIVSINHPIVTISDTSDNMILEILCFLVVAANAAPAPDRFSFPDEREERKLEPIITPPVLPVLEHLERDPSTLLPNERRQRPQVTPKRLSSRVIKPKFGFSGGPRPGGVSGSVSSSFGGPGGSHSASQSFSFGFNEGFSASQAASQSSSFNGFGGGSFSGSQASSQAASFNGGHTGSGSASQAAAFANAFNSGSLSSSSGFGFNSLNGYQQSPDSIYDDVLDVRHRGAPNFPFPIGRSKGVGARTFRSSGPRQKDDILAIVISD